MWGEGIDHHHKSGIIILTLHMMGLGLLLWPIVAVFGPVAHLAAVAAVVGHILLLWPLTARACLARLVAAIMAAPGLPALLSTVKGPDVIAFT